MKKHGFSLLLAILILAAQIPFAFAVTASGTCGDNLTWTLDNDGTLTVNGTGSMIDFEGPKGMDLSMSTGSPWSGYRNEILHIIIGDGVANISKWAFAYCFNLRSVIIPNSVTSINSRAFFNCSALTNVDIPERVVNIGMGAFESCHSLTRVTIPDGVSTISSYAFAYCKNMTSVIIPDSVNVIESYAFSAFQGESNLKDVYYSGSEQKWNSIQIDIANLNLTNATIHYNGTEPNSGSSSLKQSKQQTNNVISQYSYAFTNEGKAFGYPAAYRFPLERFQLVYGDGFAKKMKAVDFGGGAYWSGNCYGMATTAAMLSRAGSGITPSDFRDGATRPGELQVSDSAAKLGLTLAQFIEAMQISQYSATFAATRKQNRDNLSGLLSAMSAFEEGGFGPLVVCVYGNDKNGVYSGHALLAYHLDGQRLYVYDCNHPNDESRYITISNSGWSYPISDGVTWNNSNGDITYIQYETYLMDWYSRGRLLGDPEQLRQVMFFINAADATISDSDGNEIAAFQKGKMIRGIDEAYPIPQLGVTADGVSVARPQIAVWLPLSNGYSVTTRESATVSSVNLSRGVSVSQVEGGQTVSVSLSSYRPQFDDVFPGQYFYDPVMWAVGREITNGTTATTFEPAKTCTRNHILTFLWRANGSPAASIGNPFADVNSATTFGKAALWAYEKGLVSGTRFNGETPCTRAEAVTYLWKLAGRPTAGRSAFTDVPTNADYAQAVSWAVERGITNGTSQTTFNPSGTCTRGQIATFLYRAYA